MPRNKPKPSIANKALFESLQQNNQNLNLIDGSEDIEFNPQKPSKDNIDEERRREEEEIYQARKEARLASKKPISKKRNNVPVYEDQYWMLNTISKVTGVSITQLVRDGLDMIILEYKKEYKDEIEQLQAIQSKLMSK